MLELKYKKVLSEWNACLQLFLPKFWLVPRTFSKMNRIFTNIFTSISIWTEVLVEILMKLLLKVKKDRKDERRNVFDF